MQIYSVSQLSNSNFIAYKIQHDNKQSIKYNKANISFLSKNKIPNLKIWIEENDIHKKAISAYYRLFDTQKNNPNLMSQLKGLVPKIGPIKYESYNLSEELGGGFSETITQYLNLYKNRRLVGRYGVEFNSEGRIVDDFFKS